MEKLQDTEHFFVSICFVFFLCIIMRMHIGDHPAGLELVRGVVWYCILKIGEGCGLVLHTQNW